MDRGQKLAILLIGSQRRFKARARGYAMAKHLLARGHDVTLMVVADKRRAGIVEEDWDGVRTVETPDLLWGRLRSGWDGWDTLNRLAYLQREQRGYDLVHCLDTRPASIYPGMFYARRHHAPILTDWIDWWGRGGIIDEFRPRWYRLLFGGVETYYEEAFRTRTDGLTAISTALVQRAIGLGVDPARILHLPNGSWPDVFHVPDSLTCRRRVGLATAGPIIGYSSLDTYFDLAPVFEALAMVVRRYPDARLLITGRVPSMVAEMQQRHGVEKNVILTGFVPYEDLPWYLGCCDLFITPFQNKIFNIGRWPSKINDYMSIGRPIVSNPVGDVKTLFEAHDIGLLAQYDPTDFSDKIAFLIEHPDLARELGANARMAAETEYNWSVLIARLEAFYYGFVRQS